MSAKPEWEARLSVCNDEESQVLNASLLVNRIVDLDINAKRGVWHPGATGFFHSYLGASVWVSMPPTDRHRFKWLPWDPGMISTTTLDVDLLTGPMSGCLIAVYIEQGRRVVGHVGTNDDPVRSDAVKGAWRDFASSSQGLRGFNPMNMPQLLALEGNRGELPGPEIWGLVTTDLKFFALKVYRSKDNNNSYRIARVEELNSMAEGELRQWRGRVPAGGS
jgi:hypothetical protein